VGRKKFGSKMEEVTGDWRKMHNEDINNLYSSSDIITMTKSRTGHVTLTGEMRNSYNILVGKPDG
jgi:hypothetical protein